MFTTTLLSPHGSHSVHTIWLAFVVVSHIIFAGMNAMEAVLVPVSMTMAAALGFDVYTMGLLTVMAIAPSANFLPFNSAPNLIYASTDRFSTAQQLKGAIVIAVLCHHRLCVPRERLVPRDRYSLISTERREGIDIKKKICLLLGPALFLLAFIPYAGLDLKIRLALGTGALDGSMVGYPSGTGSNNRISARSDKCHFLTHRYAERNKLLFGGAGFPSGGF